MNLKSLAIMALGFVCTTTAFAQDEKVDTLNVHEQRIVTLEDGLLQLKKIKLSGYIQAQWQTSKLDSLLNKSQDMKSGVARNGSETSSYNRFGVRRGRLKATYDDFGCQAVIEFDISESGLKTKDLYLNVLDPWLNIFSVKGGVFDRPFGSEIAYSSSKLESPERSRVIQTLFPDEKDLGAMLTIQAPKTSPWNVLKLEAGLFSGNAIAQDFKSKKDFIGHLSYSNSKPTMKFGGGVSIYSGSILQQTAVVNRIVDGGVFGVDNAPGNQWAYSDRTYYGLDGQFSLSSTAGLSAIRAELITGTQPGSSSSSASPNGAPAAADIFNRKFLGGYVNFVQDIADTKHSIVLKFDFYDPNTKVKGNQIGVKGATGTIATGKADMAYSTFGLGYLYRMNNNVRIMAYYDMVSNEKVSVKGYYNNVSDNLLTVRMQYKF